MVQISINKNIMAEATQMLLQVSTVKSPGSSPNENTLFSVSPTTLSLVATSNAHMAHIKDIPIKIDNGNIMDHVDKPLMINTKKLAGIVKTCGETVHVKLGDDKIKMGSARKTFVLDSYDISSYEIPEVKLFDYEIDTKILKNLFNELSSITYSKVGGKSSINASSDGAIFCGKEVFGVNRGGSLKYFNSKLFKEEYIEENRKISIHPDFFSACLSKTSEEKVIPGISSDQTKVVLKVGNCILYKSMILDSENFNYSSNDKILKKAIENHKSGKSVEIKLNFQDFITNLREAHGIVESQAYDIIVKKSGKVGIKSENKSVGASSLSFMDAKVKFPDNLQIEEFTGRYDYTHLDIIGEVFSESSELSLYIDLNSNAEAVNISMEDSEKMGYFSSIAN